MMTWNVTRRLAVAAASLAITVSASAQPPMDPKKRQESLDPPPAPSRPAPITGSPSDNTKVLLSLREVLASVDANYPLLRAIEQERAAAGGVLLSAVGAFDLNINAFSLNDPVATFENYRTNVGIAQFLPNTGILATAGYRYGFGEFPVYSGADKTAEGGEFRAAVSIPLLRDRAIDRRRAAIQSAAIGIQAVEPLIERQRLDFFRAAARAYWAWVAAGRSLSIALVLYNVAVERDAFFKGRLELGQDNVINRIDNQQIIAERGAALVAAERAFQKAAIDLSLFLRTGDGTPLLAGPERLPTLPDLPTEPAALQPPNPAGTRPLEPIKPDPSQMETILQTAFQQRPELQRLRLQREQLLVELRQAENLILPGLNAFLAGSLDVGNGKPSRGPSRLDRAGFDAGLTFDVPWQRREALGRVQTVRARIAQLDEQIRFTTDLIRADVQDTFSALERAYEFYLQIKERSGRAVQLAVLEGIVVREGRSNVLTLNLREIAGFTALFTQVAAYAEYFRALADYQTALGIPADLPSQFAR